MLIQLPHFYEDTIRAPSTYPIGIGYIASVLKEHYDLIPLDLWIDGDDIDAAIRKIKNNVPDVFCISVYSTQYPYFKELVHRLKDVYPEKPLVAGGPGATFSYQIFLEKTKIDYCVIGEGEITLKELLEKLNTPDDIRGIAYRRNGRVILNPEREQIRNLDSIPMPDRSFYDFERYILNAVKNRVLFKNARRNIVITSRGCPYHCTFCSKTFTGLRMRSIENIDAEIQMLKTEFEIEAVEFGDELVLINKKRALQICELMKRHDMSWGCQGRINVVDEELLKNMKAAGCVYVGYGVESYTQDILDKMKKKIKVDQILPAIQMTERVGIEPVIQYMFGYPGEDDQSIMATEYFFKQIDRPYIGMVTTPLPGTQLYRQALEKNIIGDEERYLMRLTSGYNYARPIANLTEFTDQEFVQKRFALEKKVNRRYYVKHPVLLIKKTYEKAAYLSRILFNDPYLFFLKLFRKIKTANL